LAINISQTLQLILQNYPFMYVLDGKFY